MKISFLLTIAFAVLCLAGCKPPGNKSNDRNDNIVKIKIINHTTNFKIKSNAVVTKTRDLAEFNRQLKSMQAVSGMNLKHSFGYYDLEVFYKNGREKAFSVINTIFNGVVVTNDKTNKTYKDKAMENLLLRYLH
jgi:hypothetical protein